MKLPDPIAGRECGGCTVCCVELTIDDPALHKPDGVACPHMIAGSGCKIHSNAPATCRTWYCGWRFLHLSDALRPDRSRILLVPELGATPGFAKGGLRIVLVGEDKAALMQDELLNLIAKCVLGGVPIFLSWGSGGFAKRYLINDDVKTATAEGDKPRFVAILSEAVDHMAQQVRAEMASATGR